MTLAGAWGQPRNRYTKAVQPGQTGGMNAQGSVRSFTGGPKPSAPQGTSGTGQIKYGDSSGSLKMPSYADAQYQRSAAELGGAFKQQKLQTAHDLQAARQQYRKGRVSLGEQRSSGYDELYKQLGAGNAGRSGAVAQGGQAVQTGYQRGLDELARQFGPKKQKLLMDMLKLAKNQFYQQMQAESGLAAERKAAYALAGQTPTPFETDPNLLKGLSDKRKGNK